MQPVVVIGDPLSCAGFRLAGFEVHAPSSQEVKPLFDAALDAAQLIVLTHSAAAALPPATLRDALAREAPLVVVVNDVGAPEREAQTPRAIRAVLGIAP